LKALDVISPANDKDGDKWKAIRFLLHAQYQEEFDKTTINRPFVTVSATSSTKDITMFDESASQPQPTAKNQKRSWSKGPGAACDEDFQEENVSGTYNVMYCKAILLLAFFNIASSIHACSMQLA